MDRFVGMVAIAAGLALFIGALAYPDDSSLWPGVGLFAFGLVFYFAGAKQAKTQDRSGNAPMGTGNRASRIGRAAPDHAAKPDSAEQKWGRDAEE